MNRFSAIHNIRQRLAGGGVTLGSWMQIPDASLAEILGRAGYDWVALDMEHGTISNQELPNIFRALELGGTLPLVRLAQGRAKECKQALDAGAGGVIVPMIESAEHLKAVRDACRWPPSGTRGVGFSRANLFGKYFDNYVAEARSPLLVAMIEHIRAVEQLDAILDVEGLDAVLVGPYDLSASMGLTGMFSHSDFRDATGKILDSANRAGVPAGLHVVQPDESELRQRIDQGYRFLAYSIDAVMFSRAAECPDL